MDFFGPSFQPSFNSKFSIWGPWRCKLSLTPLPALRMCCPASGTRNLWAANCVLEATRLAPANARKRWQRLGLCTQWWFGLRSCAAVVVWRGSARCGSNTTPLCFEMGGGGNARKYFRAHFFRSHLGSSSRLKHQAGVREVTRVVPPFVRTFQLCAVPSA